MKAFLIHLDYPELAQAEIEALTQKKAKRYDEFVLANTKTSVKTLERLACTRIIYDVIAITTKNKLEKTINDQKWNNLIKKDFCIRSNKKEQEPILANAIWQHLKKPKVNLDNPSVLLYFYYHKDKILILQQIKELQHNFEQRKAHKRPDMIPIAMHPKLAAAMINLLGPKAKTICDPFCGTGTILIESALMKLNPIGYDIDERMIQATTINLKQYKLKATIKQADATTIKAKYIATELPFAKNTKKQNLNKLYTAFLKNCKKNKSKVIISFPNRINFKRIIQQQGYKIKNKFNIPIHKSLAKTIVVLE